MITEDIIKETYIQRIVKRDRNIINNVQRRVVRKYFYDTGTLYNFLTSRPFSMKGTVFWFRILPYRGRKRDFGGMSRDSEAGTILHEDIPRQFHKVQEGGHCGNIM